MNPYFLVAAVMDVIAVLVHGYVGHRLFLTPLARERLFSTREFGDADASRRVFVVTWHAVTAAFACSAVVMFLLAFGAVRSGSGPLLVSGMHASFLLVALAAVGGRISGLWRRPISLAFFTSMTTVALMAWLGTL